MHMLKELFSPEVHDICPNCREVCAITDIICPKCGKNLDELFEQLPDSEVSTFTFPKWMIFHMRPKVSRTWRVLNSLILLIAFMMPWEIVYGDILPFKPFAVIGWQVLSYSIPNDLLYIFFFACLYCVGSGLIALGLLSLILYTVLNFLEVGLHSKDRHKNLNNTLGFCAITSSLFFLQIVHPMMMTVLAWGYWLACVGLISSLGLETVEFISRKSIVDKLASKAT
jgi:hypothetical protein